MRTAVHATCLALLAAVTAPALCADDGGAPLDRCFVYLVRPTDADIQVDGEITPQEWRLAVPASGFGLVASGRFVRCQTLVRMLYDYEALYLGATCYEDSMGKLATAAAEPGPKVMEDDCVEWALSPGTEAGSCLRMVANAAGVQYATLGADTPWNKPWTVAIRKGQEAWSLEAKLPFESLGLETPKLLDMWSYNLLRRRQAGLPAAELTSWATTPATGPLACDAGRLIFLQRPMPDNVSPLDGLDERVGGPARVFSDIGYVDAGPGKVLFRYGDLLADKLSREQAATRQLAEIRDIIQKQPQSDCAPRYARLSREWESVSRQVQGAKERGANALACVWGVMDIEELAKRIGELHQEMTAGAPTPPR